VSDAIRDRLIAVRSRWERTAHRARLEGVRTFCLFAGYPRSGHSIFGAIVNSHPNAVISHELGAPRLIAAGVGREELFARMLARAWWFDLRGNRGVHPYAVPGAWQGRVDELRVIGDKRGGMVTRAIASDASFLERTRELVAVPLRLVHVVRDPFDNIAAIAIRESRSLPEAADYYFEHLRTTERLGELCEPGELLTVHHEELVFDPRATLLALARHLDLGPDPGWIEAASAVVFERPTGTGETVEWPAALRREIGARASATPYLAGYELV
jgi:hypothetical protein